MSIRIAGLATLIALGVAGCATQPASQLAANPTASEYGIVAVKSAHPFADTIARLKADVAAKGLVFFEEVDQQKLAADSGIATQPSTLLVFGNPALGTQFITANPQAGIDWPVRMLVVPGSGRAGVGGIQRLRLYRAAPCDRQPRPAVQDGIRGDRVHHGKRGEVADRLRFPRGAVGSCPGGHC